VEDIVEYARTYLRIGSDSYKKIWYQLKSSPDSAKWPNMFLITNLLFSLPFSMAKVKCYFSILKTIKTERRTRLNCTALNDLLEVNIQGPSPYLAIDFWWSDCQSGRRPNQKPRKEKYQ